MVRPARGVSFVVPVHNGALTLREALEAIAAQRVDLDPALAVELVLVDDGSSDRSLAVAADFARAHPDLTTTVLRGPGRGAAAALNLGLEHARHALIAQVDQDVVLYPGWLARLLATLDTEPDTAAAQGYYATSRRASLWARVMGLDLEERYSRIRGPFMNHVCTGNSLYRVEALRAVGGFDESLGYGYDNDLSYRLSAAGYRLAFCREAKSLHHWKPTLVGYLRQQYGVGYGRLDLVARHPRRVGGDDVSDWRMMLHVPMTALALATAVAAAATSWQGPTVTSRALAIATAMLWMLLALERLWAGGRAALRFGDPAGLLFPAVHLLRDLTWLWATARWSVRRLLGAPTYPWHSMRGTAPSPDSRLTLFRPGRSAEASGGSPPAARSAPP